MRTLESLKSDLEGYTKEEKLAALCDGAFLGDYDVTEDEVNDLYSQIEEEA